MTKRYRNVIIDEDELLRGESSYDGHRWGTFTARQDLAWIELAIARGGRAATEAIWSRQDGYGEAGYTPPQGFDWSGIRDSSPRAVLRMLAVATEFVSRAEFLSTYGITEGG